ncbi:DUF2780 domain-containing protein [Shewanella litorisediminis]|uniref:DUF2780 domain-containing protein n=1 Tax=Shewanella litorisediminis TaxID=1173586 RepID=A0ABX7G2X9_9GAMM|nr:DUF2780 domain-containing protein [Shewanella litorisediminis]MCL2917190.1 DUF2780 domain-containing protein [Shewanella litorisediminis]QRH01666.1 DUF2780 domain-containing protein [Shewanella litorisediminis]
MKRIAALSLLFSAMALSSSANAVDLGSLASDTLKQMSGSATQPTATSAQVQSGDLLGNLMALGLNQNQAEGGMGALLKMAQGSLSGGEFSSLSSAIPGAEQMLAAVPALDSNSGMSGLLSKAGGLGSSLQGSAMVYDAFEKLGISRELAAPMVDVAKNYLQTTAGDDTVGLLMKGLGSLL